MFLSIYLEAVFVIYSNFYEESHSWRNPQAQGQKRQICDIKIWDRSTSKTTKINVNISKVNIKHFKRHYQESDYLYRSGSLQRNVILLPSDRYRPFSQTNRVHVQDYQTRRRLNSCLRRPVHWRACWLPSGEPQSLNSDGLEKSCEESGV